MPTVSTEPYAKSFPWYPVKSAGRSRNDWPMAWYCEGCGNLDVLSLGDLGMWVFFFFWRLGLLPKMGMTLDGSCFFCCPILFLARAWFASCLMWALDLSHPKYIKVCILAREQECLDVTFSSTFSLTTPLMSYSAISARIHLSSCHDGWNHHRRRWWDICGPWRWSRNSGDSGDRDYGWLGNCPKDSHWLWRKTCGSLEWLNSSNR